MEPKTLLIVFLGLKVFQYLLEKTLARTNRSYYLDSKNQEEAKRVLGISDDDFTKSLNYTTDKYQFGQISGWVSTMATLAFIGLGGVGWTDKVAASIVGVEGSGITRGLVFFAILGVLSMVLSLPFSYYSTFFIEEKHGFNRQTVKGFFLDLVKSLLVGAVLGGLILSAILWIMGSLGNNWWIFAWAALSGFSILTVWLYPTFLAPIFNKFSPIEEGELKEGIFSLAEKVGFKTAGVFIMDASKRSSHGNAYFTGMFGAKRIVLFDTLVDSMSPKEVIAVLAHELGHFKLNHIRWQIVRSIAFTGVTFYLLSLALPMLPFYQAFGLNQVSNYSALLVFSLWFGLVDFYLQPLTSYLSRKNEFAADSFAKVTLGSSTDLAAALLKLREKSKSMAITHPLFSKFYHSHPPLMERLAAMRDG